VKLEQQFEVDAPLERVWAALIDFQRVAPCLPGAEITEQGDDGVYRGDFTVKLGPTTAAYRGELSFDDVDEAAHRVTMKAFGQDKRGQGAARATILSALREDAGTTHVEVETDLAITGRLARFGRGGMIKDVSNKLLGDFSSCLAQTIESEPSEDEASEDEPSGGPAPTPTEAAAPPQPAKPIKGFSLFLSVLRRRLRRLFGRGE
jgi:uncharacterized protein